MKRVSLALFCSLLGILVTAMAIPSQVNGQTEIPTEKLLNAVRTINTAQVSYRDETGRYATREEMLAFLRTNGLLSQAPIDLENPKPYELAVTTSPDGMHYQITLKRQPDMSEWRKGCTAVFSDEEGVIFIGTALGCEASTR